MVALQQPRPRLPELPPGCLWQRTAVAPPTPLDSAGQQVCTCTYIHTINFFLSPLKHPGQPYLGCLWSNSVQRSQLLIGVGTATISSSFLPASSLLFAKYNTTTCRPGLVRTEELGHMTNDLVTRSRCDVTDHAEEVTFELNRTGLWPDQ